jgi:hypothetical protein
MLKTQPKSNKWSNTGVSGQFLGVTVFLTWVKFGEIWTGFVRMPKNQNST